MANERSLVVVQRNLAGIEITHRVVHTENHVRIEASLDDFLTQLAYDMEPDKPGFVEKLSLRLLRKIIRRWFSDNFVELTHEEIGKKIEAHAPAIIEAMKASSRRMPPPNNRKS